MTFEDDQYNILSKTLLNIFDAEKFILEEIEEDKLTNQNGIFYQKVLEYTRLLNSLKFNFPNILDIEEILSLVPYLISSSEEKIRKKEEEEQRGKLRELNEKYEKLSEKYEKLSEKPDLNSLKSKILGELQPLCSKEVYSTIEQIIKNNLV